MKPNLGSLITSIDPLIPKEEQMEVVDSWRGAASSTFIWTDVKEPDNLGYFYKEYGKKGPVFKDVLSSHFSRVRGRETIGIALPNIFISSDFSKLYEKVEANRISMSWAAGVKTSKDDRSPSLFIITTSILPHIIVDVPAIVQFTGTEWAEWLDKWLKTRMQRHMYLDGTEFGLINDLVVVETTIPEAYTAPVTEPEPAPSEPEKVATKPKKRAKKAKK